MTRLRQRARLLGERNRRALDLLFVGLLFAVSQANSWLLLEDPQGPVVLNALTVGVVALSFVARRAQPLIPVAAVLIGYVLLQAWLTPAPDFGPATTLLVIVAAYSVAAHAERRPARIGLGLVLLAVGMSSVLSDPGDVAFPVAIFALGPWLMGRVIRGQTLLARELAEKEELVRHAREGESRRAVAAERTRIAREMHDVLAHNLSVMVIQASAAGRIVERDPDTAARAAKLVVRSGREALAEIRHLFGAVRHGEGEDLEGLPGLANVDGLLERARAAGLRVTLDTEGEPIALAPGADMAAYRVVQEALTNTLKHAGPAHAAVRLRYAAGGVTVEVEDDGAGPGARAAAVDSGGHGLVGMRERLALYGGDLDTGRRRGGGFAVVAHLPAGRPAAILAATS